MKLIIGQTQVLIAACVPLTTSHSAGGERNTDTEQEDGRHGETYGQDRRQIRVSTCFIPSFIPFGAWRAGEGGRKFHHNKCTSATQSKPICYLSLDVDNIIHSSWTCWIVSAIDSTRKHPPTLAAQTTIKPQPQTHRRSLVPSLFPYHRIIPQISHPVPASHHILPTMPLFRISSFKRLRSQPSPANEKSPLPSPSSTPFDLLEPSSHPIQIHPSPSLPNLLHTQTQPAPLATKNISNNSLPSSTNSRNNKIKRKPPQFYIPGEEELNELERLKRLRAREQFRRESEVTLETDFDFDSDSVRGPSINTPISDQDEQVPFNHSGAENSGRRNSVLPKTTTANGLGLAPNSSGSPTAEPRFRVGLSRRGSSVSVVTVQGLQGGLAVPVPVTSVPLIVSCTPTPKDSQGQQPAAPSEEAGYIAASIPIIPDIPPSSTAPSRPPSRPIPSPPYTQIPFQARE